MDADDQVQGEVAAGWRLVATAPRSNLMAPRAALATNRFSIGGAMGTETNDQEIPYATLLKRARCLPIFGDELKDRILEYLPHVHTLTFTNWGDDAKCLRGFGALLGPANTGNFLDMSLRSTPDLYLSLRKVSRPSFALYHDRQNFQLLSVMLARAVCCQLLSKDGIGPGDTTRLRWLLGGGPWARDSNVRVVHNIMKVAFNVLLGVASCLPHGVRELFIYDLTRVSFSWSFGSTSGGLHGWRPAYWEGCMLGVLQGNEGMSVDGWINDENEMYYWLRADLCGEGACEFAPVGALRTCGEQCQLCLSQTHSATERECLCSLHGAVDSTSGCNGCMHWPRWRRHS
jgi:hypothetical protein